MKYREFKDIVAAGEGVKVEFKRKLSKPEKIAKEICAFANTKGGVLLVGIDDDSTIVGIKSEKVEIDIIEKACMFFINPEIVPEYQIFEENGKDVLCVIVNEGNKKPYKAITDIDNDGNGHYQAFIRVGENSIPASSEMTRLLKSQSDNKPLKMSIGDKEKRLFEFLNKYERVTVKDFATLVNISSRRAERLLIRLVRAGVIQIHTDSHNDYFTLL
jgi:predicted HTH transcriptional regulator